MGQRLTFCGSRLPHDVISSGGALAVTLITGPSVGSSAGFQLQYSLACKRFFWCLIYAFQEKRKRQYFLSFPTACNRSYGGIEGRIVSPRWPGFFRPNDYCEMTIESPPNTTISLYFNLFRLANSGNCSASSLEVCMATQSHPAFFLLPPILPAILFILVDFSSFSFFGKARGV